MIIKKTLRKKTFLKLSQWENVLKGIPDFKGVLDFKSVPELSTLYYSYASGKITF